MGRLALIAVVVAGCGASSPPPGATGAKIALVATADGKDDVIVAQVNGRPVWGSCVIAQSIGTTRDDALHQCIDFELLAQAAEARGLAADPGAQDALTTALVERLVATRFEDRFASPADLGKLMDQVIDDNVRQFNRPEYRTSTFVRILVDAKAPPERDALARHLADQIAARVRDETGMFSVTFAELADPFKSAVEAAGFQYERADFGPRPLTRLVKPYGDALFGIVEVGRTAGPVRTDWGWDVILWTGGSPAMESTREQLAAEVFPDLRRSYFDVWAKEIEHALGVHVEYVDANVAKLDKLEIGGP